jgi:hypothetical protein
MEKPAYDHHCGGCRFLGTTGPTPLYPLRNAVDHYICPNARTLVQRGGSERQEYKAIDRRSATEPRWSDTITLLGDGT